MKPGIKAQNKYHKYLKDIKNFKVASRIKSGGFGSVFSVKNLTTNEMLAAKVLYSNGDEKQYKLMISREIGILIRCQHPTIIKFYGYSYKDFQGDQNTTIFMELAKNGSLEEFLQKAQKGLSDTLYDNTQRQILLVGIARGMMYLHQLQIIHRDLKPGNILLDENLHPHITDFGLSKFNSSEKSVSQSQQCGTSIYMAPEIIQSNKYSPKVDVYSFGILMYEIVTNSQAYPQFQKGKMTNLQFLNKVVYEDYRPQFKEPVKSSIKKLIERCWSKNSDERPTFEEIFKKLAYNIEDSIDDILAEQEDEEISCYYLDDVDADEVIDYADEINHSKSGDEEGDKLKEMVDRLVKSNSELLEQMKAVRSENDSIKEENRKLKKENKEILAKISAIEKNSTKLALKIRKRKLNQRKKIYLVVLDI